MKQESLVLAFSNVSSNPLNLNYELNLIRDEALRSAVSKNSLKIIELNSTNYNTLSNLLNSDEGKNITMLHYSGHSSSESLSIEWNGKDGNINAKSLVDLFKAHKKFRFVFLNGCYSKEIAKSLTEEADVKYVIGTTHTIKDRQASIVAAEFYKLLANTSKTIEEAFKLTTTYFQADSYTEDNLIRKAFRSIDINDDEISFPWQLFAIKNLSEEDKNWTLIPSANFKLSLEDAKKKIKILCIYDKGSLPYYKAISPILQSDNKLITHGIWEINVDFNLEDFEKELNASDIILHFVNDSDYIDLISSTGSTDCFNDKNNFFLPIRGTLEVMTIYTWYSISQVIESDNRDFLIKLFGRFGSTLDDTQKLIPSNKTVGEIFNDFFFNSLRVKISQIFIDEIQLKKDLKEMPVIEVEEKFVSRPNKEAQLFNLIIEGTSDCAHQLVVNKIRIINQLHLKTKVLSFKSECGSSLITSVEGFWESMCSELGIDKNLIESSDYPKECIKCIIGILQSTNIIIVLENLEDNLLYKQVISSFWSYILRAKTNYETKGGVLKSNLFVCLTNKNIANMKFQSPLLADEAISEIRISPIRFLSDTEFNSWKSIKQTKYLLQTFQKLSFDNIKITRDINTHSEDPPRKIAITNICQKLQCSDLIPDIDKEILQYE